MEDLDTPGWMVQGHERGLAVRASAQRAAQLRGGKEGLGGRETASAHTPSRGPTACDFLFSKREPSVMPRSGDLDPAFTFDVGTAKPQSPWEFKSELRMERGERERERTFLGGPPPPALRRNGPCRALSLSHTRSLSTCTPQAP